MSWLTTAQKYAKLTKTAKPKYTKEQTKKIGDALGVDWNKTDLDEATMGMNVELEHGTVDSQTNVTDDSDILTFKIMLAHLNECGGSNYYSYLAKLEEKCKQK